MIRSPNAVDHRVESKVTACFEAIEEITRRSAARHVSARACTSSDKQWHRVWRTNLHFDRSPTNGGSLKSELEVGAQLDTARADRTLAATEHARRPLSIMRKAEMLIGYG